MDTIQTGAMISTSLSTVFAWFFAIWIKLFLIAVFVIIMLFFAKKLVTYLQQTIREHNAYEDNVVSFSNIVGDVFFYLVLVLSACIGLYIAWFKSTYIILWATFATWYAFKELFQSVMSGILIMTTKEFVIGDLIEVYVDDVIHFWKIELITIRYTVLRRLDMTRVIIPNRLLTRIPVMTFAAEENVRLQTSFKIQPYSDLYTHISVMKKVISDLESITEKDFTLITLDAFEGWSLYLTAYFYFDPKAGKLRFRVISEVNIALAEYFKEHGISFAYPHEVKTFDTQDVALQHLVQDYVRYS